MADYINRTAFLEQYRSLYCSDCHRRKNEKGKIVYEIGDAPCRACDTGDMLDAVEDFPAADMPPLLWRDDLITGTEFMTHSGANGYEIHFRTPDRKKYLEVEDACRKMIDKSITNQNQLTNADRIRAMSDEELAEMFCRAETDGRAYGPSGEVYWLDWLRSPAGGDDHG